MKKEEVDAVGQGRVWTGQEALQKKLIDKLGGLRDAMEEARQLGGLPDDAPIVELPARETSLIDKVLKLAVGVHAQSFSVGGSPLELLRAARAFAPFFAQGEDKAQAHIESTSADLVDESVDESVDDTQ